MPHNSINVFVPPISSFPELTPLGLPGGSYALKDRIQVLPKAKPRPSAAGVAAVAACPGGGGGVTEVLEERDQHFLYVIDSQGRLLEHMRYSGDDYRAALRESFGQDSSSSASKPNLARELPSSSCMQ